jgi:hypothetical protein
MSNEQDPWLADTQELVDFVLAGTREAEDIILEAFGAISAIQAKDDLEQRYLATAQSHLNKAYVFMQEFRKMEHVNVR